MISEARREPSTPPARAREFVLPRALVKDLFEHNARIYWTDFILTLLTAYGGAALYLAMPTFSWPSCVGFVIAAFALFRCGVFIHEIAHMPRGRMSLFKASWNILFGIPFLMPSFLYESHADHHNPRLFGTLKDAEYLALGAGSVLRIVGFVLQLPLLPVLAIFRFLVVTPVSFLHPRLRRFVLERASSLAMNTQYRRVVPVDEAHGTWVALEIAIFLELAVLATLLLTGHMAWGTLGKLYVLAIAAAGLNWARTVAAHGYTNTGDSMSFVQQLEDSITVIGHPWLTALLFPVGLRYHCLHHMFPALPYHSMGIAHRRLMAELPADSPYRTSVRRGLLHAVRELWRTARASSRQASAQSR